MKDVPEQWDFAQQVDEVLAELGDMLKAKNAAYGNSALDPIRIFSRADTVEQLNVRLDDKLSRIVRGHADGEEVEGDLIGYLILRRIARLRATSLHEVSLSDPNAGAYLTGPLRPLSMREVSSPIQES
jgi:hypothetical protein